MKRLVLVGAGHAHAFVLRDWIDQPLSDVELVLVSPSRVAPYSGMVPGWLAGHYRFDEIGIDFATLTHAAAARFVADEAVGLDTARGVLRLRRHEPLRYDIVSFDIGSTLEPPAGGRWLSMRPLGALRERWETLLATLVVPRGTTDGATRDASNHATIAAPRNPTRVIAAGGGPAGVESLLAVLARLRSASPGRSITGLLLTKDNDILPTHAPSVRSAARRVMHAAGVEIRTGVDATAFTPTDDDIALWATGALAHAWLRDSGVELDAQGFVRIDEHLRSLSHDKVYAAGDCAAWSEPLPKAGVIAVRQGPVLSRNLRAAFGEGTAQPYRPQRRHLSLLSTADGRAIASWGAWSATGRWVWRWKDHIDRKFIDRFKVQASWSSVE